MTRFLLRAGLAAAVLSSALALLGPREAEAAAVYSVNFCPGDATCPTGITEASLSFAEIANADPNDYTLTVKITGNASAPALLDVIQVKVDGVAVPGGYESLPTLTSSPAGATWSVFFDQINNGPGSCASNSFQGGAFCAQSSNNGVTQTSTSNIFVFNVDFVDSVAPLGVGSAVNLRAAFNNSEGGNAGILSPGGGTLSSSNGGPPGSVSEPGTTSLALVSLALLGAGIRARRNRQRS